ncbi:salivary C-type lectin 1-like [Glandiceps talaboti]
MAVLFIYGLVVVCQILYSVQSDDIFDRTSRAMTADTKRFVVVDEKVKWEEAANICENKGGQLAQPDSSVANDYFENRLNVMIASTTGTHAYWIGLRYDKRQEVFRWYDRTAMTYSNWGKNAPGNFQSKECVRIKSKWLNNKYTYPWDIKGCSSKLKFICEIPDECPGVQCVTNPCDVTSCADYPAAECRPNYCGGCNAEFFDMEGNLLDCTIRCPDTSDIAGACIEECRSHADCQNENQVCCSNGCGHSCINRP